MMDKLDGITAIQECLMRQRAICDWWIRPPSGPYLTVYVVPATSLPFSDVARQLSMAIRTVAGNSIQTVDVVAVNRIPVDAGGNVDSLVLASLTRQEEKASEISPRIVTNADVLTVKAELSGGPAPDLRDADRTLPEALCAAARQIGHGISFIARPGVCDFITYRDLLTRATQVATSLRQRGCKSGNKVILQLASKHDFVLGFWACQLAGLVPVPIAVPVLYMRGTESTNRLIAVFDMLPGCQVLTTSALRSTITDVLTLEPTCPTVHSLDELPLSSESVAALGSPSSDDLALLLLTSGSTGKPKLVAHSHRTIVSRAHVIRHHHQFGPDDVSLNWFPLDHVGGLLMFHVQDVVTGCQQIQVEQDVILGAPLRWLDLMEEYAVSVTWAPNFAYGLINAQAEKMISRTWDLSKLRFILNGGEAVVPAQSQAFLQLLSGFGLRPDSMFPAWGMSETGSGVTYDRTFTAEVRDEKSYASVGAPIPGVDVRIVDDADNVVSPGVVGHLQVRGAPIMLGYHQDPSANAQAFTEDGWFRTGDLGIVAEGALTVTGRAKDTLIVNGQNFSCACIEATIEALPEVEKSYTAVSAIRQDGQKTDEVAVFFCTHCENTQAVVKTIQQRVREVHSLSADYIIPLSQNDVPKTSIGKIQRAQLRQRVEAGEFEPCRISPSRTKQLKASKSVRDWFCRPRWEQRNLSLSRALPPTAFLIVSSGCKQARLLGDELISRGHSVLHKDEIVAQDIAAAPQVVFLLPSDGALDKLIRVLKEVHRSGRASRCRLFVVSFAEQKADAPHAPYASCAAALLKTALHEMPAIVGRFVDVEGVPGASLPVLIDEITAADSAHNVILRAGLRYVDRLERVDTAWPRRPSCLAKDALYVISGGLGGIGQAVAKMLLADLDAKILLLGRTALPLPAHWNNYAPDEGAIGHKLQILRELHAMGAVQYASVDVSDATAVEAAVKAAESRWQVSLGATFHLAGDLCPGRIEQVTPSILTEALRGKYLGGKALQEMTARRPDAVFIAFSSVNGFAGGAGAGCYAAANRALDSYCEHERSLGRAAYSLGWSRWHNTGMSLGVAGSELAEARGMLTIREQDGIQSLLSILRQPPDNYLVGLDLNASPWSRMVNEAPKVIGRFASDTVADACAPAARSGEPDGLNQAALLPMMACTSDERSSKAPMLEVIKAAWCEILELDAVSDDDNFFDLGGHSLLAPQLCELLESRLGCEVKLVDIFRYPKVCVFSKFLEGRLPQRGLTDDAPKPSVCSMVKQVWCAVLELDDVCEDDNFFDLGGHSLLAPTLVERLHSVVGCKVDMVDVFKYPTVSSLARELSSRTKSAS